MFNQINVDQALGYLDTPTIKRVLVVGSGGGADIIALRNRLGPEPLIVGIDIDIRADSFAEIPNTFLVQTDITKQPILGNCFDLAYSFATFEHIHDLQDGWQAMLSVLRPGGLLWSVASPLWFSPFGHHKPMFREHPWIHLIYPTPELLIRYCDDNGIDAEDGVSMIHHINYLFNPVCFNRHPASAYHHAAAGLRNAIIEKNDFDYIDELAYPSVITDLVSMGHHKKDLTAQTHRLIARRS
jgi:SAM-dependent methyltransferase